ncbi:hypothetical protein F2S73_21510 [Pseudomonas syringae pv. actinidiae]|nr:hypothetical protein [Pseudomonas syringae pv. actinidiae]
MVFPQPLARVSGTAAQQTDNGCVDDKGKRHQVIGENLARHDCLGTLWRKPDVIVRGKCAGKIED